MILLEICKNSSILRTMLVIKILLKIILIIGPIIVVLFSIVNFFKVVISGDAKDLKTSTFLLVKRIIACLIIFLLPTIMNYTFNSLVKTNNDSVMQCIENATLEKVKYYEQLEKEESLKEKETRVNEKSTTDNKQSKTKNKSKSNSNSRSNSSKKSTDSQDKTVPTLKNTIAIDNKHFNYAKINTKLKGNISWKSNNENIVTVSNGIVKSKSNSEGETTIIASNGSESEQYRVVVIAQRNAKFVRDDNDYSNEVKEAYINNAEILCHSKDISNLPECQKATFPVYTGDFTSAVRFAKTATRHEMTKDIGISAANYLIFISSKKQTLTLLEKINGEWKVKYSFVSSTGRDFSTKGDYSFAFYAGVVEYDSNPAVKKCKSNAINQFKQGKKKGGLRIKEANIKEPSISGRWIHYSSALGYPSSAGCNHLSCENYETIRDIVKDNLGTRIIVF